MEQLTLLVRAKINLALDVIGVRQDGYHQLDMCISSIDVGDILHCVLSRDISVTMDGKECGVENIAYRTIEECVRAGLIEGMAVDIEKGIPFSSGLGGSSADCAGVLWAARQFSGCSTDKVNAIAAKLCSDGVFMLQGGIGRAQGKGDDIQPLPYLQKYLVVAKPVGGALTKNVFAQYDKGNYPKTSYTQKCIQALAKGDVVVGNALQQSAKLVNGGIGAVVELLEKYSTHVSMSGSGSAVFATFDDIKDAQNCYSAIHDKVEWSRVCKTMEKGIEVLKK